MCRLGAEVLGSGGELMGQGPWPKGEGRQMDGGDADRQRCQQMVSATKTVRPGDAWLDQPFPGGDMRVEIWGEAPGWRAGRCQGSRVGTRFRCFEKAQGQRGCSRAERAVWGGSRRAGGGRPRSAGEATRRLMLLET